MQNSCLKHRLSSADYCGLGEFLNCEALYLSGIANFPPIALRKAKSPDSVPRFSELEFTFWYWLRNCIIPVESNLTGTTRDDIET